MNILFVSEFFPPVNFGGAEWSSYYLAKGLAQKKGFTVSVLTPNYMLKNSETQEKFKIVRFPFYLKLKKEDNIPSSIHFVNPIWFFTCATNIYMYVKKNKTDVLHINGKYSIGPARFANLFLGRKILVTVRDYTLLCNYGFCINEHNKACNLFDYFTKDFKKYIKMYLINKNPLSIVLNFLFALYGRAVTRYLKLATNGLPIVLLSKKHSEIYKKNGFKKTFIVGNSISFATKPAKIKKDNLIIYAGRLTPGKGVDLLLKILPAFFKTHPDYKFIFCGSGLFEGKIRGLSQLDNRILLFSKMDHSKLLKLFAKSKLVVVPSVWQEPFGRVALESISQGTPAVVSNRGGLPDVIKDKRWGYIVEPNVTEILRGIEMGLNNNKSLSDCISKDYQIIRSKFGSDITENYIKIYRKL